MSKKSWGILAGVSAILAFYLTAGTVGAWFILDAIAGATNQSATLFDNWWQIVLLAGAIVSALAAVFGAVMFFGKEKTVSRGFFNPSVWSMFTTFFAIAMAIVFVGDVIAAQYDTQINNQLGINPWEIKETGDVDEDTEYYKSDYYNADGSYNHTKMRENSMKVALQAATEGSVLLWNDNNALPLDKGAKINLFGGSSVNYCVSMPGSGKVSPIITTNLKEACEENGLVVNAKLFNTYQLLKSSGYMRNDRYDCPGVDGNCNTNYLESEINEAPWAALDTTRMGSDITTTLYEDAAVMTITRMSGEEQDTYKYFKSKFLDDQCFDNNYMDLSKNEADVLAHLQQLKAEGKIKKVVLVINSGLAVQFKNIRNYGIDACLWVGVGGSVSYDQIAQLLSGKANPSGHLPDTYVYDNFSAPATENFGDFTYKYTTRPAGLPNEATYTHNDKYIVYQEGIYVGYRYYETRYADSVEGNGNAGGSAGVAAGSEGWKYSDEVAYPFGHGLSYTTFEYSNYSVEKKGDAYEVKMTIKNTGSVAGKDVMEVYLQKPYTEYDKATGIEKSAVELVGFAKTKELAPGESQTLTVTVDGYEFKSYDAYGKKTYIVEKGDYYLAAGADAHDALNNILAAKGYTVENGMTANGNGNMTHKITFANDDYTTYSVSPVTGNAVTNQFDDVDINLYEGTADQQIIYLSRSDWQGTYPSPVSLSFNATIVADMAYGPSSVEVPAGMEMPKFGTVSEKYGELNLAMLMDVDFDNEYWDALLDQLTWEDAVALVVNNQNGATSVGLKGLIGKDGPVGLRDSGLPNIGSMAFPMTSTLAATWNEELLEEIGDAFGMEILHSGVNCIYGPGGNIHRTAFSGRNAEYFSEDGFLSGKLLSKQAQGLQNRGILVTTKHFTLNEQERNRYGGTAWANEQSIRELYLKCFEAGFTEGQMNGVMTSFARIGCTWAGAHEGLLKGVCREEWGWKGYFTTDAAVGAHMINNESYVAGVLGGQNTWLFGSQKGQFDAYKNNAVVATAIRESCHYMLYSRLHSNVMNGVSTTSKIVRITTWWESSLDTAKTVTLVITGSCLLLTVLSFVIGKKEYLYDVDTEENEMKEDAKELKAEKKAVKAEKKADKKSVKKSVKKNGKKKKGHPLATMMAIVLLGGVAAGAYLYFQPAEKPDDPGQSTPSTPVTPDDPVTPVEPTPSIPRPDSKEYRFEAENGNLLAGDSLGDLTISNENGKSEETFVGNFSSNTGAKIQFKVISTAACEATFSVSVSKCDSAIALSNKMAFFVNDEWFDTKSILPARQSGEAQWITFEEVVLGTVNLKEGENIIEVMQLNDEASFNVNRISLYTDDATLTEGTWEAKKYSQIDPSKKTYRYEAENAVLVGDKIHNRENNGTAVGNIGDAVGGSITFTMVSDRAESAVLSFYIAMYRTTTASNGFILYLNDEVVPFERGSIVSNDPDYVGSWTNYTLCTICTLQLKEGTNTLKISLEKSNAINMDYISLNTDAVLDGVLESAPIIPEHTCEHVCPDCGGCLDEACSDPVCADNRCDCPETPVEPEHTCEHVCPDCGGCLDNTCTDSVCADNRCDCEGDTPVAEKKGYRYEAETSTLSGGKLNKNENGGTAVGSIGDSAGESLTFTMVSDKAATAELWMCMAVFAKGLPSTAFSFEVNEAAVTFSYDKITSIDPYYTDGKWDNYTLCKIGTISLVEGTNTLKVIIGGKDAACNIDYIRLDTDAVLDGTVTHVCGKVCADCGLCTDATCVEEACWVKCGCARTANKFEAENASSNAFKEGYLKVTQEGNSYSGEGLVGGVTDCAVNHAGEAYLSFNIVSDKATTADLLGAIAFPGYSINASAFTIEVNGVVVNAGVGKYIGAAYTANYGKSWTSFTECMLARNISLNAGVNTVKITINSGAMCNIDYFSLVTDATVSFNTQAE